MGPQPLGPSFWIWAVVLGTYFMPIAIAALRNHRDRDEIALVTTVFGWTGIGWLATFIWSIYGRSRRVRIAGKHRYV